MLSGQCEFRHSVLFHLGRSRGRGVPNRLMDGNNQAKLIDGSLIVESTVAVNQFEGLGGRITSFSPFGEDPLRNNAQLVTQREAEFHERYPDFSNFFYTVVNGDCSLFREGILFIIDVSKRLQTLI